MAEIVMYRSLSLDGLVTFPDDGMNSPMGRFDVTHLWCRVTRS